MFPESAIIVCLSYEEYSVLMQYLDDNNFYWYDNFTHQGGMDQRWEYGVKHYTTPFCHNFIKGGNSGYCREGFYRANPEYWNKKDPKWNFCSVEEFITWTGGEYAVEEEIQIPDPGEIL